ncbi:MAG: hypothetical protein AAF571_05045 [Verrucomicrobiota bacterium]
MVVSNDGNIIIRGRGGDSGSDNAGILLQDGSQVGTMGDGNVTLVGRGGGDTSGADNNGVGVRISNAAVGVVDGDLSITGIGDASGDNNEGIEIQDGSLISSFGDGSITLTGTGRGRDSGEGVQIEDALTAVTSETGNIRIEGTSEGRRDDNAGINIEGGAVVSSIGTAASTAATITLIGTAEGQDSTSGVLMDGTDTEVTSIAGAIQITGTSTGTDFDSEGVVIQNAAVVSSTGTGSNAATVTIDGTGGDGMDGLAGIVIQGDGLISSIDGDIVITGQGGNGGNNGVGVVLFDGGSIESLGTGADAANIIVVGTGGAGVDENTGVFLNDNAIIDSEDGDISITGTGGMATGEFNTGVSIFDDSAVGAFGEGDVTILGNGGTGTNELVGAEIAAGSNVGSFDGNLNITGNAGIGTGDNHFGVGIYAGAVVGTGGTGNVTIIGNSSDGGTDNLIGVLIEGVDLPAAVASQDGDITITGTGGNGSGDSNIGVSLFEGGAVLSLGAGNVSITGVAGSGNADNYGVEIAGTTVGGIPSVVGTTGGNLVITGTGGAEAGGSVSEAIFADADSQLASITRTTLESLGGDILVDGQVLSDELQVIGTAADAAFLTNATNLVNTLAAAVGSIEFQNVTDLTVGTVNGTVGVTTQLVEGMNLEARSGTLVIGDVIVANNGGEIFLRVGRDAAGQVDLDAMQTTTGDFIIRGGDFADTFNLRTVSSRVVVRGQDGDDIFNIGNLTNSLDDVTADIVVRGQDSTGDTLNINDQGDTDANIYDISDNTRIRRLNGTDISINYDDTMEVVNLNGGTSADDLLRGSTTDDTFTLTGPEAGVFSNPNLLFDVNWTGIARFNGQGDGDNDTVDYSALAGPVTVRLNTTVRNIENLIGSASGADILEGQAQAETFEFAGGTITVDLLTVTGFENVDGRGDDDTFNFNSGAFGGAVAGGGGNDTFNFLGGIVTGTVAGEGDDDTFSFTLANYTTPVAFTVDGGNETDGDTVEVNGGALTVDGTAGTVTDGNAVVDFTVDIENLTVNSGSATLNNNLMLPGMFEVNASGDVTWNGAIAAGEVLIQGDTLFMNNNVTSTASGITLVANTSFQNNGSALNPASRFLVYSVDPFDDTVGGLTGSVDFGILFPDLPGFSGNGFVYSSSLNNSVNGRGIFLNQQLQNALSQLLIDGFDPATVEKLAKFLNSEEGRKILFEGGADKDALQNILLWLSSFDVA